MSCNDEVKSGFWQLFFVKTHKNMSQELPEKNTEHAPEKLLERVQHMENNNK